MLNVWHHTILYFVHSHGSRPYLALAVLLAAILSVSSASSHAAVLPDTPNQQAPENHGHLPALGIHSTFGRWVDTVYLRYDATGAHPDYTDNALMLELIRESANRWERVSGIRFDVALKDDVAPRSGEVPVRWEHAPDEGWAGRAGPDYGSYDNKLGYIPYAGGSVSLNNTTEWYNLRSGMLRTLTHELGHLIGLGHSDNPDSMMFANPYNQLQFPARDDIRAVQTLYGPPDQPVSEWAFTPPPASPADGSAPRVEAEIAKQVQHAGFDGAIITRVDEFMADNTSLYLSGSLSYPSDDISQRPTLYMHLVTPSGQLQRSRELTYSPCGEYQQCRTTFWISNASDLKTQSGLWHAYLTAGHPGDPDYHLLGNTSILVDSWNDYNRPPEARLQIEPSPSDKSIRVRVIVNDPEGDNVTVGWHLPRPRADWDADGILDNHVSETLRQEMQTEWRQITFTGNDDREFFIHVNDDGHRYGNAGNSGGAGRGFQTLLRVSVTIPESGQVTAEYTSSHVPATNDRWLSRINGIRPEPAYELPYQRIGTVSSSAERLYSCVLITTNGQPAPGFNGEQDVTFAITSLAHGSLRLIAYRDAEPVFFKIVDTFFFTRPVSPH